MAPALHGEHLGSFAPGFPPGQPADALPLQGTCWLPAGGCCRCPVPKSLQTLTLGFFTPLPLGCSSESCHFRGLFSAGGVSTRLESWGSGVAFSPKGSDWRRKTHRDATRASGSGAPILQNPDVPPQLLLLEGQKGLGCRKNIGLHSCLPLATV